MAHFGFLTLSMMGHLFPMSAFARELQSRGHRVTFFCFLDGVEFLRKAGVETVVVAEEEFPLGYTRRVADALGQLSGQKGVNYTIAMLCEQATVQFAVVPDAIAKASVDALIVDQFALCGGTIADHLKLPRVHVAAAMLGNVEDGVPPINVDFGPGDTLLGRVQNRVAMALVKRVMKPLRVALNEQREAWGLPLYTEFFNERFEGGPQICQEPPSFEYPRKELPEDFYFVGPLHRRDVRDEVPFPWERLDHRPLVYASMGTIQNGLEWVFRTFAEACAGLEVQLVLSLGGGLDPAEFAGLPGDPVVVRFAPQLRVLERTAVCITHAGLNTALECLAHGVPMVAIPITNDQPAVAARVRWTGTGRSVGLKRLRAETLREAVKDVMGTAMYRTNAKRMRTEIAGLNSLQRACEIAEGILA